MGFDKIKGALFGEKAVRTPKDEIQRLIAKANPDALEKYLQKNPSHVPEAIAPFKRARFDQFYSKPSEDRDKFLQCGLVLLHHLHASCPDEAWAAFTSKDRNDYPTAQWIAAMASSGGRHPLAQELSTAMLSLAERRRAWHTEEDLPPEQQFFRQWMKDQAEPGFQDHRPRVSASELSRWMYKLGPIKPKGWETEFMHLALSRDFIRTTQDARLMLNRSGLNLYTTFDDYVQGTPLEGTTGNNILHMVALLKRHDQRFLFEVLNDLHFRDGPNSAGLYGAQAIMDLPGEINTKHGVRPAFGMQLPLRITGNPAEHPFESLAVACELEGLNQDAHHLRLSMRASTDNNTFRHFRNVAEYAMYNDLPDALQSAMELGDRVVSFSAMNPGPHRNEEQSISNSVLYEALEMWASKPKTYERVLGVLLNAGLNDSAYQAGAARTLNVFMHHHPDVVLDTLPIGPTHPTLSALTAQNPELHERILAARQLPLHIDAPQLA